MFQQVAGVFTVLWNNHNMAVIFLWEMKNETTLWIIKYLVCLLINTVIVILGFTTYVFKMIILLEVKLLS